MPQTPFQHIYVRPPCNPRAYAQARNTPEIAVRLRYWTINGLHTANLPAALTLARANRHRPALCYAKAPQAQLVKTALSGAQ